MIACEGQSTIWLARGARLVRVAPEQLRFVSELESDMNDFPGEVRSTDMSQWLKIIKKGEYVDETGPGPPEAERQRPEPELEPTRVISSSSSSTMVPQLDNPKDVDEEFEEVEEKKEPEKPMTLVPIEDAKVEIRQELKFELPPSRPAPPPRPPGPLPDPYPAEKRPTEKPISDNGIQKEQKRSKFFFNDDEVLHNAEKPAEEGSQKEQPNLDDLEDLGKRLEGSKQRTDAKVAKLEKKFKNTQRKLGKETKNLKAVMSETTEDEKDAVEIAYTVFMSDIEKSMNDELSPEQFAGVVLNARRGKIEVSEKRLSADEKQMFAEAKKKAVDTFLKNQAVREVMRAGIKLSKSLPMRWVLTWKLIDDQDPASDKKAKARFVIVGFRDEEGEDVRAEAPTQGRLARNVQLQLVCSLNHLIVKGDVSGAFLQGRAKVNTSIFVAVQPLDPTTTETRDKPHKNNLPTCSTRLQNMILTVKQLCRCLCVPCYTLSE